VGWALLRRRGLFFPPRPALPARGAGSVGCLVSYCAIPFKAPLGSASSPLGSLLSPATVLAFILRRILQSLAVMAVVAFIAFGLFNFTGDPVAFMVGQDATVEEKARLRTELGLDQPSIVQFARFVGNAAQGEFGISLRQGRSVATLLAWLMEI